VHLDSGIASLSIALGHDASGFDLDGPLPEIPESNASKSARQRVIERARRDNLTVRQLAQIAQLRRSRSGRQGIRGAAPILPEPPSIKPGFFLQIRRPRTWATAGSARIFNLIKEKKTFKRDPRTGGEG
jgi:hypothetical protein